MKIDLKPETIIGLYRIGIITHSNEAHKGHHVGIAFPNINDEWVFECFDCGERFTSKIIEIG